jgi:hypothetical protein
MDRVLRRTNRTVSGENAHVKPIPVIWGLTMASVFRLVALRATSRGGRGINGDFSHIFRAKSVASDVLGA